MNKAFIALFCTLGTVVSFSSNAAGDLYWCIISDNHTAIVQQLVDGADCRLLEKGDDEPKKEQTIPSNSDNSNGTANPRNSNGFPNVTKEEQLARDQTREGILRFELELESTKLKDIRSRIERNQVTNQNSDLHDFYVLRYERHIQNVKALRQELARMQ